MIKIKSRKEYFELSRARRRIVLILMLGMFIVLFAQAIKLAAFDDDEVTGSPNSKKKVYKE